MNETFLGLWAEGSPLPDWWRVHGDERVSASEFGAAVQGVLAAPDRETATGDAAGRLLKELWARGGVESPPRLQGGFAAAVMDPPRSELALLRDPGGTRPLYWAQGPAGLAFGSRIGHVIRAAGLERRIDPAALEAYLAMVTVPDPLTIFQGVHQVPPGTVLVFSKPAGPPRLRALLPLHYARPGGEVRLEEEVTRVRQALEAAVRRLAHGAERLSAFLSGGFDSTVVAGLARRAGLPVQSITIGFSGGSEFESFNEFEYARIAARLHGTEHHEATVAPEEVLQSLPHLLGHLDQPSGDAINSYLVSRIAARHADVTLTGTGGDEMFVGSGWYLQFWRQADRLRAYSRLPKWLRHGLGRTVGADPTAPAGTWRRRLGLAESLRRGLAEQYAHLKFVFRASERGALLAPRILEAARGRPSPEDHVREWAAETEGAETLTRLRHLFLRHEVAHLQSRDLEVMSAAHGLKARSPLVDGELMAVMAGLPEEAVAPDRRLRSLMIRAFRDLIPEQTIRRRKHSFIVPMELWARGCLRGLIHNALSREAVEQRGLLRWEAVERVRDGFYSGRVRHPFAVWNLALLELWCRVHLDGDPLDSFPEHPDDLLR